MGGQSTSQQTQNSTTAPWAAAQPALQGILGQLNMNLGNTALTGNESGAINSMVANAGQASQYAPQIQSYAKDLLGGGGATDQSGALNQTFQDYSGRLQPVANGLMMGGNSALKAQLDSMSSDITNNINGQFAGAGRDFSGAHFNTLGRGIASGLAPVIAGQYNIDTANQRSAADALYGAGTNNAAMLSGLQQQRLANQGQGVTVAGQANDAANAGNNQVLQAEAARRGIPVQALGLLAQLGIPIAGLGGQSTGRSEGTQQMSGADQFYRIASGAGNFLNFLRPSGSGGR